MVGAVLLLFGLWSNSFVAMSWVLGAERAPARLDWVGLTQARFLPVTLLAAAWLALRGPWLGALWARRGRLVLCGVLSVPVYSLCLYWAIQRGIPAPIASLLTALSPLVLLVLGAVALGERLSVGKGLGFAVAVAGLGMVAAARGGFTVTALAPILVGAVAPTAWAVQSILSKPAMREVPPDVWTAGYLVAGGTPLCLVLPWWGGAQVAALDAAGWVPVLYLGLACTLGGFALWSWLLTHHPAGSLGFTVFLNPPMSLGSQLVLAACFPGSFVFALRPLELAGCAVVLAGLGLAVRPRGGEARLAGQPRG